MKVQRVDGEPILFTVPKSVTMEVKVMYITILQEHVAISFTCILRVSLLQAHSGSRVHDFPPPSNTHTIAMCSDPRIAYYGHVTRSESPWGAYYSLLPPARLDRGQTCGNTFLHSLMHVLGELGDIGMHSLMHTWVVIPTWTETLACPRALRRWHSASNCLFRVKFVVQQPECTALT